MVKREQVAITIGLDGSIQAETIGYQGSRCLNTISLIEDLLEAETIDSQYKKDFFESNNSELDQTGELNVSE